MRFAALAAAALAGIMMASPALAVTVETRMSTDFQEKLKKELGLREANVLSDILTKKITDAFEAKGVDADKVVVTLEDAKPNRPTFQQVSAKPGLDPIRSISLGGAELSGIAYDAAGNEIGRLEYRWYESDLGNVIGVGTWSDARSTFSKFANRFADKLS